jgi:flagellar biosynthesis/type III secretory pathway M-ring protein FliF/YscJ
MNPVWSGIIWSLAPTVLVGLIFWYILRVIVRADRKERDTYAKMEAEERAKRGMPQKP